MCPSHHLMARRADEELVAGVERRDGCALEEIERRYRTQLRDQARRMLVGSGVDPDDLVQETVMRVWAHPPNARMALAAWLHVVLRNRGYDLLRSPGVRRASNAPLDVDRRAARDALAEAGAREQLRELVGAVQDLPPRQARALVLHALEGRPQREIAGELGTTEQSVKAMIHRARRGLADRIDWAGAS